MTVPTRTFLLLGIIPWPRTSIRNIFCWKRLFFFIITSLTKYWFVNASYSHKSDDINVFIFPLKNINGKLSIYSQEWERRESAMRTHDRSPKRQKKKKTSTPHAACAAAVRVRAAAGDPLGERPFDRAHNKQVYLLDVNKKRCPRAFNLSSNEQSCIYYNGKD